jgi:TRAP-type C4-dicarboxylate transport system substrate-binding protein
MDVVTPRIPGQNRIMPIQTLTRTLRIPALVAIAAMCLMALAPAPAAGQAKPITVKMATLVPDGTSWHLVLKEVAAEWGKISGGKVKVNLYPGGTAGDDPDVVRKMNLGSLQAAVLTSVGLAELDKSIYAFSIPMAFEDYDEVYYVIDKMKPRFEANLLKKGYVVLNWADGGWAQFFAKKPVATPDDLKKLKLFQWAGDQPLMKIWQSAGFNPVAAASTELPSGLQTGLFEAFNAPPQVVAITRYYENARYMTDLKWALLMGATVIRKETWDEIPADLRPKLLEASQRAGTKLQAEIRKSGDADVTAMKGSRTGLVVVPVDAKTKELWRKTAEATYPSVRGTIVPADAFDEALKHRDDYRRQKAAAKK